LGKIFTRSVDEDAGWVDDFELTSSQMLGFPYLS
jgi:hypothetical protein